MPSVNEETEANITSQGKCKMNTNSCTSFFLVTWHMPVTSRSRCHYHCLHMLHQHDGKRLFSMFHYLC